MCKAPPPLPANLQSKKGTAGKTTHGSKANSLTQSFSPEVVWDLDDDQAEELGAEDDETIQKRAEYHEKLRILEEGLKELDAFTARPDSSSKRRSN